MHCCNVSGSLIDPCAEEMSAVAAKAAAQNFVSIIDPVDPSREHRSQQRGRWVASISHDGTKHHLGAFDDEQEAARHSMRHCGDSARRVGFMVDARALNGSG